MCNDHHLGRKGGTIRVAEESIMGTTYKGVGRVTGNQQWVARSPGASDARELLPLLLTEEGEEVDSRRKELWLELELEL